MQQLENGLRKGWYKFEDSNMTLEKWLKLPTEDRLDKYKIGLTEKGKREAPSNDLLMRLTSNDFTDKYIKSIEENNGEIQIELTEKGEQARKLAVAMGIDFTDIMKNLLKDGLRREFNQFVEIKKDKPMDGQMRR